MVNLLYDVQWNWIFSTKLLVRTNNDCTKCNGMESRGGLTPVPLYKVQSSSYYDWAARGRGNRLFPRFTMWFDRLPITLYIMRILFWETVNEFEY